MAITNAQQYQQLVNKPANGKRPGYRGQGSKETKDNRQSYNAAQAAANIGRANTAGSMNRANPFDVGFNVSQAAANIGKDSTTGPMGRGTPPDELDLLYITGVKPTKFPGPTGMLLNTLKTPRNFTLRKNIDFFKLSPKARKAREKYGLTVEGYEQYMKDRLSGDIDAAGNTVIRGDADPTKGGITTPVTTPDDPETDTDTEFEIPDLFLASGGIANFQDGGMLVKPSTDGKRPGYRSAAVQKAKEASYKTSTTAKAPPSMGFGNPPPDEKSPGPTGNKKTKVPPIIKNAVNLGGDISYLKNLIDLNPVGIMKNIGGKILFDKIIGDQTSLDTEDENMMLADVSAMDIKRKNQFKNLDYGTAKDIGMINPTMTQEEFEGVKSGEITEPTGQFAADGGRIGAMEGGMMSPEGGIMDLESGRQMYFLGKLV